MLGSPARASRAQLPGLRNEGQTRTHGRAVAVSVKYAAEGRAQRRRPEGRQVSSSQLPWVTARCFWKSFGKRLGTQPRSEKESQKNLFPPHPFSEPSASAWPSLRSLLRAEPPAPDDPCEVRVSRVGVSGFPAQIVVEEAGWEGLETLDSEGQGSPENPRRPAGQHGEARSEASEAPGRGDLRRPRSQGHTRYFWVNQKPNNPTARGPPEIPCPGCPASPWSQI